MELISPLSCYNSLTRVPEHKNKNGYKRCHQHHLAHLIVSTVGKIFCVSWRSGTANNDNPQHVTLRFSSPAHFLLMKENSKHSIQFHLESFVLIIFPKICMICRSHCFCTLLYKSPKHLFTIKCCNCMYVMSIKSLFISSTSVFYYYNNFDCY